MAPMAPSDHATATRPPGLAAWLVEQRWFRSKTRALRTVEVHDSVELPAGNAMLLVLLASFADGAVERYLVPAVVSADRPREAADGDGVWRSLVALMTDGLAGAAEPPRQDGAGARTGAARAAPRRPS